MTAPSQKGLTYASHFLQRQGSQNYSSSPGEKGNDTSRRHLNEVGLQLFYLIHDARRHSALHDTAILQQSQG